MLDITRAGYTGHEMLWASGTVHMNGRVYDPGTGRMISADPTIPQMWNAQTHNRYAYVYNNPLSLVDPTGFSGEEPTPGATPLDSVEVTGQRIYTNPFNFRFALTTPWESQPTVDPHGFLLNQLANSAEEEAAAAEQAIYQNPGSRLNKLRQQRADRARTRVQAYAKFAQDVFDGLTSAADQAVDYWAAADNPVMGTLAMTMTEEYALSTTLTLIPSAGVLRWAARPFWQYSSTGATSSTWLARGWGWKPPYAVGSEARNALALPPWNSGAVVKPVNPSGFVHGPRPVQPQPQWGHPSPTGWEYRAGPWGGP